MKLYNHLDLMKIRVKKSYFFTRFLLCLLAFIALPIMANPSDEALNLLTKMTHAVKTLSYDINYVSQEKGQFVNTYQYKYLGSDKQANILANLIYLEGPSKQILFKNNVTSYYQPDSSAYAISSTRIVEAFPDVIYTDFSKLTNVYDFIQVAKSRTANRNAQLVRITAKDQDRYNYVIWIDEQTYLPLRIDLLDQNIEIMWQMKIVDLDLNFDKQELMNDFNDNNQPTLLVIDKQVDVLNDWSLNWLPIGFTEQAAYNINFYHSAIESKLFTDGIFSFTINVSDKITHHSNQVIQQGSSTIFSINKNNKNIIIIGNLPLSTIEKIAQNMDVKSS